MSRLSREIFAYCAATRVGGVAPTFLSQNLLGRFSPRAVMPLRSAALESCLYPFSGDVPLMLKKLHLSFHGRIIDFQMYRSPVAAVWVAISQKGSNIGDARPRSGCALVALECLLKTYSRKPSLETPGIRRVSRDYSARRERPLRVDSGRSQSPSGPSSFLPRATTLSASSTSGEEVVSVSPSLTLRTDFQRVPLGEKYRFPRSVGAIQPACPAGVVYLR